MAKKNDTVADDLENAAGVRLGGEPFSSSLLVIPSSEKSPCADFSDKNKNA